MKTKTQKPLRDGANKVTAPLGCLIAMKTHDGDGEWYYGAVLTRHGYVRVHAEPTFTSLSVVHAGKAVYRHIQRAYTRRGLVTLADRFAAEICG